MKTMIKYSKAEVGGGTYEVFERGSYRLLGTVQRYNSRNWNAWDADGNQVVFNYGSRDDAAGRLLDRDYAKRTEQAEARRTAPESAVVDQAGLADVLAKLDLDGALKGLSYQEQAATILAHFTAAQTEREDQVTAALTEAVERTPGVEVVKPAEPSPTMSSWPTRPFWFAREVVASDQPVGPEIPDTHVIVDHAGRDITFSAGPVATYGHTVRRPEPDTCPHDGEPLSTHIGGKPCVVGEPSTAKTVHDLPVARWAHETDNR
jgi:hypothetical protein